MVQYYWNKYEAKVKSTYLQTFTNAEGRSPYNFFNKLYDGPSADTAIGTKLQSEYQLYIDDTNESSWTLNHAPTEWFYTNVGSKEYFFYHGVDGVSMIFSFKVLDTSTIVFYRYAPWWTKQEDIIFEKGALVQSNIIASESTYKDNAKNYDGYFYLRGSQVNVAPTQPGAFTQPSGTLEIGDSKVFAVGASSDENGNLSKYIWEASINGAAYSKAGETTSPSFTYTIPTATSLRMRVKAVDTAGLDSVYRESSSYTVQPQQYYYDKYTTSETTYYNEPSTWQQTATSWPVTFDGIYKSYMFNSQTKMFSVSGGQYVYGEQLSAGSVGYTATGETVEKYTALEAGSASNSVTSNIHRKLGSTATEGKSYSKGSLLQTGIQASASAYPSNGRHTDGYWYVRGLRVSQSIAPPSPFTAPAQGKKFKPNEVASIVFGSSTAPNLSLYEVDYRYNGTGAWTPLAYNNTLMRSFTITIDKTLKTLELRVRAKNTSNVYSDYVYSEPFIIEHNVAPTVSLTGPSDNATLYETDTLNIAGTAHDADADQSVTVFYQINNEQRKVLATNVSQMQINLSKQLTFKGGKLYDGDTALTGTLADGVAHKLEVWAEDSEKASSAIVERTFYVVPNRAPLLSVDAVVPSGVVDEDKFKISGTASDQDANSTVKVTRCINAGNVVEIYSGTGGAWEFDLALSQLVVGQNTIVIEVVDNYGAKASKTVTLNKKEMKTPILQSVARYKIEPPKGSAKGVLLFIQRDEELDVKVELSMTLSGEQEQYETLTPVNTVPVQQGVVEDTFEHEGLEAKQNIILKITPSRTDLSFNHKIHLISGAVD